IVADGHAVAEDRRPAILGDVDGRVVLDVRAGADADALHVAADDGVEPEARVGPDDDVADHDGRSGDPGGGIHARAALAEGCDHGRGIARYAASATDSRRSRRVESFSFTRGHARMPPLASPAAARPPRETIS